MISGRMPQSVEKGIRVLMSKYASNLTSVLVQFPSQQIASIIDGHASTLTRQADRDVFYMTSEAIVQLVQKYVRTILLVRFSLEDELPHSMKVVYTRLSSF